MNLNISEWKVFQFGDLISNIYKAQAYKDEDLIFSQQLTNDSMPYVTRTDLNNGVKAYALKKGIDKWEKGNALVIGDTTATISYQKDDFIAGDHIVVVRSDWLNEYTGLFITTLLKKERFRYSYGRAFKIDIINETLLKLPVNSDGNPNWDFMENYIKSLRYKPISTKIKSKSQEINSKKWKYFQISQMIASNA